MKNARNALLVCGLLVLFGVRNVALAVNLDVIISGANGNVDFTMPDLPNRAIFCLAAHSQKPGGDYIDIKYADTLFSYVASTTAGYWSGNYYYWIGLYDLVNTATGTNKLWVGNVSHADCFGFDGVSQVSPILSEGDKGYGDICPAPPTPTSSTIDLAAGYGITIAIADDLEMFSSEGEGQSRIFWQNGIAGGGVASSIATSTSQMKYNFARGCGWEAQLAATIAPYAPPNTISLTNPPANATTTNSAYVNFWGGEAVISATSTLSDGRYGLVTVQYTNGSYALSDAYALDFSSSLDVIWSFPKSWLLSNGTWTATPYLYADSSGTTLLATGNAITFYISDFAIPPPLITPTCQYTTSTFLADPLGNIQQGICSAALFLFIPSTTSTQQFINLKTALAPKPPFGYFTAAQTALNSLTEGTSSIELMSATTTTAFSGIFTPLKTGLTWILWLFFVFWVFHRLRNFDFF